MSQLVRVSLIESDYSAYATTLGNYVLSRRHAAILLSVAVLLSERNNWNKMSDADWNTLEAEVSGIIEVLND